MKLRGETQRRKKRIRKAAFFSFVGSLVLTGFITPPIVQAPQGYKPDLSMEENRSKEQPHSDKPGVQLSQEKGQETKEKTGPQENEPESKWMEPVANEFGYTIKQSKPHTAKPVHTASTTQQNWSRPRSDQPDSEVNRPGVTSVPSDSAQNEDENKNANQPQIGDDEQPQEPENGEELSPEEGNEEEEPNEDHPSNPDEPAEPEDGNDDATDGDVSGGESHDERNSEWNAPLGECLIKTKESNLAP